MNQHPRLPVRAARRQAKITTPKTLLLSMLPKKNRFIFDKTRQNKRLDTKHNSVTGYKVFLDSTELVEYNIKKGVD